MLSGEKTEDVNLANFIIQNVTEELVGEKYAGYTAEVDGMMGCLVNIWAENGESPKYKHIKDEIDKIAFRTIEFLEKKFGLTLSVAVSGVHAKAEGIAKAYSEAMEVNGNNAGGLDRRRLRRPYYKLLRRVAIFDN